MKSNNFYEVTHGRKSVGFFRNKKNAKKYLKQFKKDIEGHVYNLQIIERTFFDYLVDEDSSKNQDPDDFNWKAGE